MVPVAPPIPTPMHRRATALPTVPQTASAEDTVPQEDTVPHDTPGRAERPPHYPESTGGGPRHPQPRYGDSVLTTELISTWHRNPIEWEPTRERRRNGIDLCESTLRRQRRLTSRLLQLPHDTLHQPSFKRVVTSKTST